MRIFSALFSDCRFGHIVIVTLSTSLVPFNWIPNNYSFILFDFVRLLSTLNTRKVVFLRFINVYSEHLAIYSCTSSCFDLKLYELYSKNSIYYIDFLWPLNFVLQSW